MEPQYVHIFSSGVTSHDTCMFTLEWLDACVSDHIIARISLCTFAVYISDTLFIQSSLNLHFNFPWWMSVMAIHALITHLRNKTLHLGTLMHVEAQIHGTSNDDWYYSIWCTLQDAWKFLHWKFLNHVLILFSLSYLSPSFCQWSHVIKKKVDWPVWKEFPVKGLRYLYIFVLLC